jgi:RNA polymerase sigma-70 factor (ECF subfamily)
MRAQAGTSTTATLLRLARANDAEAINELMARYAPRLRRWAHGRLPATARALCDTPDIVQDALIQTLRALPQFDPAHENAFYGYLRQAVMNKVRDEIRRARRLPPSAALTPEIQSDAESPLERAIGAQAVARYEQALSRLAEPDRAVVVARLELGMTYREISAAMHRTSPEAVRKAAGRALLRLATELQLSKNG